jgi:release factor glutamine methyltransferase
VTVLEILNKSTQFLKEKGVESPRLSAELLLSAFLKCRRLDLYLNFDKPLTEAETDGLRQWVVRRGKREPLQYITGSCEFFGLNFEVNPSVLIPRPETETLVETVVNDYREKGAALFLDLCTGSGAIAVAVRKKLPDAVVTASDISPAALETAQRNAETNGVEIEWVLSDLFNGLENRKFDVILSNPPYCVKNVIPSLQPEVRDHEPVLALDGGEDGLDVCRLILSAVPKHLNPSSRLYLEAGEDQMGRLAGLGEKSGLKSMTVLKDLAGKERIAVFQL